jgi:hypothetical protein
MDPFSTVPESVTLMFLVIIGDQIVELWQL